MLLFHSTYQKHVAGILRDGLLVRHDGRNFNRREMFGDSTPRVFLGTFKEAINFGRDVLPNEYNRRRIALLSVELPDDHPLVRHDDEWSTTRDIGPEFLRLLWTGTPSHMDEVNAA